MITTSTRLKLQGLCSKVAQGQFVSLTDRIYLQKFAERDRTVQSWLSRAHRMQQNGQQTGLDGFLADLNLGSNDPGDQHNQEDDLGGWFGNTPPWLRRD